MRWSDDDPSSSAVCGTYHLLLDTIAYTLDDALYGVDMITGGLIIPKPHHPPPFHDGIPTHFNDPILELFSRHLHPTNGDTK